jgi:uncharacterized membrane protein
MNTSISAFLHSVTARVCCTLLFGRRVVFDVSVVLCVPLQRALCDFRHLVPVQSLLLRASLFTPGCLAPGMVLGLGGKSVEPEALGARVILVETVLGAEGHGLLLSRPKLC